MAPTTALAAPAYYTSRGIAKITWVETFANFKVPTLVELDAATDLSPAVGASDGWDQESETLTATPLNDRRDKQIAGAISYSDSTLELYASLEDEAALELMPQDEYGFIARYPKGFGTAKPLEIFRVRVAVATRLMSVDGSEVDRVRFQYSIEDSAVGLAVPAST
ncbi:hypothetical protein [Pseudonocardia sp. NPDC049635]|uniref:phage tail tube protein n=1 Tax=Pseudonocardia sp. NPDC049635 TaxID=3155506 RepID=UPI0033E7A6BA